ncbi:gdsl-like lipase acylhydrolase domain protein [Moniliophthora roreri]|nr:gdsl-like lipase acylhydrolase domain protein [Moniliophthora roreri]
MSTPHLVSLKMMGTTVLSLLILATSAAPDPTIKISNKDPCIYFHGRWDDTPRTWWAGSGLKLNTKNLKSLSLELGPHTSSVPPLGVSIDYQDYFTVNVTQGITEIPLTSALKPGREKESTLVRLNVEGWQNNQIDLQSIILNSDARLLPYKPSKLTFQFIGDSLSAGVGPGTQGQFLPQGVNQAWPFLFGEHFKAETRINAQPGATLTDMVSYGNQHGVSFMYFRTEDTGYFWTVDHNYTTPWNFARDVPAPTHLVIHIGFVFTPFSVYTDFLTRIRGLYPRQPVFVFTPWGWPNANGSITYYYDGAYQRIVGARHSIGDKNVFLVNTTGWVGWDDVFDNLHPNVPGMRHIADQFIDWLNKWGLKPEDKW